MNFTKPVAMVFFAATLTTVFTQENGWRGIVPLHSTRKDVEALLGSPKESRSVASTFQSKDGRIRVFYSSGFCREGAANDWNVPADTVVTFIFEPNRNLMFADLKLNKTKYERVLDHHVQGAVHYFNKEEGIRISTRILRDGGEDVQTITYEPSAKDYHLSCGNASRQQPDGKQLYSGLKFDEYTDLTFEAEKRRLDNLALYLLKSEQAMVGYLIVYSRHGGPSSEAKRRAKRAKNYIIKAHRIDAKRILTIMGGCRETLDVELYVTPNLMVPPIPNSDCDE